jgi:4-hydroxybenzoate polyprenyltransferase
MLKIVLKELRLNQWIKNFFVLIPLVFDRQLLNSQALIRSISGFFIFCLVSSSVYIINDIMDVEADRNHEKKKKRPIASGVLPINLAWAIALIFIILPVIASFFLSTSFAIIIIVYFLINLAYSKKLKHLVLIDVMIISVGFVLRVAGGVSLIVVERFSPWLYVVTTLLSLFIALGKRRGELNALQNGDYSQRKVLDGYTIPFLDQLITIVSATTIVAYSLYTFSAPNLPDNHAMMLTIPFSLYAIFRYIYLIQVKNAGSAPDELVMIDRPLQITFVLFGLSVLVIFYLF